MPPCIVSACLLGTPCRYDGRSKGHDGVRDWVERARAQGLSVHSACPEAPLGTPRPAATLRGGDGHDVAAGTATVVRLDDGTDLTQAFCDGAAAADHPEATLAILKARSPSCGVGTTNIDGRAQPGDGVFAARLRARGVALFTEEGLPPAP